jgi:hypothetical protein
MNVSDNIAPIEKTDEFVERVAIQLHSRDSDEHTLKWAKQPGKYRAGIRRDVRDVIAALKECGFEVYKRSTVLAEARKAEAMKGEIAELREALRPFSADDDQWPEELGDVPFNFGHIRRARTLLNGGSDAQG